MMYGSTVTLCDVWPQLFDVDEDNSITRDEFASLLRSTLGVCDLDVSKLFDEIDIDGSECITYGEYNFKFRSLHPLDFLLFNLYFPRFKLDRNRLKVTLYILQFVKNREFPVHVMVFNKLMTFSNIQSKSL